MNPGKVLVSVVVVCFERVDGLRQTVAALEKQTFDDFELIAVDQTGLDELRTVVESARIRARYVYCPIAGPPRNGRPASNASHARNVGVLESEAKIVAFTDDDCEPRPDWVEKITEPIRNNSDVVLVAGSSGTAEDKGTGSETFHTDRSHPVFFPSMAGSSSLAARTDAFFDLGGFDTAMGPGTDVPGSEDNHLIYRALRYADSRGLRVAARRDAVVDDAPLTKRSKLERSWRYMPCFGMYLRREFEDSGDEAARDAYRWHRHEHWLGIGRAFKKRSPYYMLYALVGGVRIVAGWHRRPIPPFVAEIGD